MNIRAKSSLLVLVLSVAGLAFSACGSAGASSGHGPISIVAAENFYGNVAFQIGGRYVHVTSVENNPNTDPHTYEVSPGVATAIAAAQIVIQNGLGYDDFMHKVESASPSSTRRVIDVQTLLRLPGSTPNPHLWYSPSTMPRVARAVARDLTTLRPRSASYFSRRLSRFLASLRPWRNALASFRGARPHAGVATTEPVADYMLAAAGIRNLTPFRFQLSVMNGVDPYPQDVRIEDNLLSEHLAKALVYNQQVTDSLTQTFIGAAQAAGIPIVGVYETMPEGYSYQSWMLTEVRALSRAVTSHESTGKL